MIASILQGLLSTAPALRALLVVASASSSKSIHESAKHMPDLLAESPFLQSPTMQSRLAHPMSCDG